MRGSLQRVEESRLKGNHEAKSLRLACQGGRDDPRVIGYGERRQKAAAKARDLRRLGHLGHVVYIAISIVLAAAQTRSDAVRPDGIEVTAIVSRTAQ